MCVTTGSGQAVPVAAAGEAADFECSWQGNELGQDSAAAARMTKVMSIRAGSPNPIPRSGILG